MLEVYTWMLAEFRRVMDSRKRGFGRFGYLLTFDGGAGAEDQMWDLAGSTLRSHRLMLASPLR
ncbi:hypothetical protein [Actinoplanes xinjiangensis]|uniref:hypothetical protein n=1 Tax=Actinoplanes xinjiangensis TaxID=512350 RepID=UPI003447F916